MSCGVKAQNNIDQKCNGYYVEKYSKFFEDWSTNRMNNKLVDSTLYYLDKQINCNPKNFIYIQEKANFLIYNGLYNKAIKTIDSVSYVDPFFKMMKGTLSLKLNVKNSDKLLKDAHNKFNQYLSEDKDPNDLSWKIILDNYFFGKDYALEELAKAKRKFEEDHQITNFESIEFMIKEMSKEEILFELFSIK